MDEEQCKSCLEEYAAYLPWFATWRTSSTPLNIISNLDREAGMVQIYGCPFKDCWHT